MTFQSYDNNFTPHLTNKFSFLVLALSASIVTTYGVLSTMKIVKIRFLKNIHDKNNFGCLRELSSVGRDMHCYIQGPGFEPGTPHLFTLKEVNSSH